MPSRVGFIDVHQHALPPAYVEAILKVSNNAGDGSGFPMPPWSMESALANLDKVGIDTAVLSVSTPGIPFMGTGSSARALTRTLNEWFGEQTSDPKFDNRFGFFGVLPDWQDVDGTLAELDYLYQTQRLCYGITTYTSYGGKLLGDSTFKPIWEKLQSYKALVFIHPTALEITPSHLAGSFPQPIIDFPLATTRTAADLVLSRTMESCPDVDVILSHAGGALPCLRDRLSSAMQVPEIQRQLSVTVEQVEIGLSRFYYDLALGTSAAQLYGLLETSDGAHVLYGTDIPFAPNRIVLDKKQQYQKFVSSNERGSEIAPEVLKNNALALLNKHAQLQQPNM